MVKCDHCNSMFPAQPNAPTTPPVLPAKPLQCMAGFLLDRYLDLHMKNPGKSNGAFLYIIDGFLDG